MESTLPRMAHPAPAPLDELLTAIIRSIIFPDVGELDIWEWASGNPRISRITDLDHGLISDLILTRIMEHTGRHASMRRPCRNSILRCDRIHPRRILPYWLVSSSGRPFSGSAMKGSDTGHRTTRPAPGPSDWRAQLKLQHSAKPR